MICKYQEIVFNFPKTSTHKLPYKGDQHFYFVDTRKWYPLSQNVHPLTSLQWMSGTSSLMPHTILFILKQLINAILIILIIYSWTTTVNQCPFLNLKYLINDL